MAFGKMALLLLCVGESSHSLCIVTVASVSLSNGRAFEHFKHGEGLRELKNSGERQCCLQFFNPGSFHCIT